MFDCLIHIPSKSMLYIHKHTMIYTYIRLLQSLKTSGPNHRLTLARGQPSLWPRPWLVSSFWRQRLGFFLISQKKLGWDVTGHNKFQILGWRYFWMAYILCITLWGKKGIVDSRCYFFVDFCSRFHLWDGPFRGLEAVCATGSKIGHHKAFLACASGDVVSFAE